MSLAERRGLRLFTLCVLFLAQGIPWGFMAITLPSYLGQRLSERGVDDVALAATIGTLISYTTLPFTVKFVWGPLIDGFTIERFGRRRPWIVFAQLLMALTVAAMLAVDPVADVELLLVLVLVHTACNAMQNVAVDALAIDLLDADERGRASGFMYGAKYLGGAVGGIGLGTLIKYTDFRTAILVQAIVLAAITAVPLLVRERASAPPPRRPLRETAGVLWRLARLRSIQLTSAVMFVQFIAGGMLSGIGFGLYLKHLGWDDTAYSQFAGGPALVAGAIGASAAGIVADKLGRRRVAAVASAALAALWLGFSLAKPFWQEDALQYGALVLEPFLQGATTAALFGLCMDTSLPRTAATQYVAYTSLMNLGTTLGANMLGYRVLAAWDYRGIYLAAGIVQLVGIALLPLIDAREARRKLGEE